MVTWKQNKNDLPMPKNEWQRDDFIDETEQVLEILNEHFGTRINDKDHLALSCELLECLNPADLDEISLSNEWKSDVKIWLFKNEAIRIARVYTDDHPKRKFFKEVCANYINLLQAWNKTWDNLRPMMGIEESDPLTKNQSKVDSLLEKLTESIKKGD